MELTKVAGIICGMLFVLTIVACGGITYGSCDSWFVNAPDTFPVGQGSSDVITFAPTGADGIHIIDARFLPPANTLGITIVQHTGNSFDISASPTTPVGNYSLTLRVQSSTNFNTSLCVDSIDEPITITVH